MAASPVFAATPRLMAVSVSATADTSWTAPTTTATVGSGGSSGTKVSQIDVMPVGTTVAGVINIFAYDGTTYTLLESVQVSAVSASTTVPVVKIASFTYDNLNLPSSSW